MPRSAGSQPSTTYARIYEVVCQIPRGRVASYGQVARVAGFAGHARLVGYALSACEDPEVPWQRVVNARGEISARSLPGAAEGQRERLEAEGVTFDRSGRIPFAGQRWNRGLR